MNAEQGPTVVDFAELGVMAMRVQTPEHLEGLLREIEQEGHTPTLLGYDTAGVRFFLYRYMRLGEFRCSVVTGDPLHEIHEITALQYPVVVL